MNKLFKGSNIIIILFLAIVVCGGVLFAQHNKQFYAKVIEARDIKAVKNLRTALSSEKMDEPFKIITGIVDKNILRKKEVADFTYYEIGNNDYAVLKTESFSEKEIADFTNNVETIYDKATDMGAQFLYVNTPARLNDEYKKKLENVDYQDVNDRLFLGKLDNNIPVLNLRNSEEINALEQVYYKTDHHFTIDATFVAFKETVEAFKEIYGEDLDADGLYTDINNYDVMEKKKVFSGSTRVNIGGAYVEKEDYKIFAPKYDTLLGFKHYDAKKEITQESEGPFIQSLCNMSIFEDDSIVNKYNVYLGGATTESVIENRLASNDKKLLVLSTSYARSYVPYVAQLFAETRFLDPQVGRYEKSVIEYMEDYKPDTVIIMNETYTAFAVD